MKKQKVLDPQQKWLEFKSRVKKRYDEFHVLKAFTEYAAENGKEACKTVYNQLYMNNISGFSIQAKKVSSQLELLSPHSIPGTRLIQGICIHSTGKRIFKQHKRR